MTAPEPLHMAVIALLEAVDHTYELAKSKRGGRPFSEKAENGIARARAELSALDRPLERRDDTAELIAALEAVARGAEYDSGVGEYAMTVATMRRVRAALARVKGGAK